MQHYLYHALGREAERTLASAFESGRHPAALTRLAALTIGTEAEAVGLALVDRRCRIAPSPSPLDHLLRAEMLYRAGDKAAALADVARALKIEPEHLTANRKCLEWADGAEQHDAARCLLASDPSTAYVRRALEVLATEGLCAAGRLGVVDGRLQGWIAWRDAKSLTVTVDIDRRRRDVTAHADPQHPLASALGAARALDLGAVAAFGRWQGISNIPGQLTLTRDFTMFEPPEPAQRKSHRPTGAAPDVTIIVPVYRDLEATRACLDSLLVSIAGEQSRIRVVVVDDASPEPELSAYLQTLPVDKIVNARNLGFVGAVNEALATVSGGDVVLLNADTAVPPGAIGRLRQVAHAAPDIGTVTPLSNNGELTSLPTPFRENPLPSPTEIASIDRAAALLDTPPIDLPSGIGFCLYITRACLEAADRLSHRYERGYYEDVHLCLSAAAAGFRNVCAANVFVGHAGTRSFGKDKRRLVVRNLARLKSIFPEHEREVAAFVAADPMRALRHAIARETLSGHHGPVLVARRNGMQHAEQYARRLVAAGTDPLLIVQMRHEVLVRRYDADFALAAETSFPWPADATVWQQWRSNLNITAADVFCPVTSDRLGLDCPGDAVTLHIADAATLTTRRATADPRTVASWRRWVTRAQRIVAADELAVTFALRHWPDRAAMIEANSPAQVRDTAESAPPPGPPRLGILLLDETADCRRLLGAIGRRLSPSAARAPRAVVIGSTADDLGLMRGGRLWITGPCDIEDFTTLLARNGLSHLLVLSPGATYGAPLSLAAEATSLPLARFVWTDTVQPPAGHLHLDPATDDDTIAAALADWLDAGNPVP